MPKPDHIAEVNRLIEAKVTEQRESAKDLAEHFSITYESLKPINVLKSTLKEAHELPNSRRDILQSTTRMAARYLFKQVAFGNRINQVAGISSVILDVVIAKKMMGAKRKKGLVVAIALKKILELYGTYKTNTDAPVVAK